MDRLESSSKRPLGRKRGSALPACESLLTARLMIWGSFSMLIFVKMRHLQMRPCPLTPRNKVLQTSTILEGVPSQQGHCLTAAPPDRSWQVALGSRSRNGSNFAVCIIIACALLRSCDLLTHMMRHIAFMKKTPALGRSPAKNGTSSYRLLSLHLPHLP